MDEPLISTSRCYTILSPYQAIATYRNMLRAFSHRVAMCCNMLGVVGSILKLVKFEPTTPNMSQQIPTRWPNARNMLRPTMLRYVVLACCDRSAGALGVKQCGQRSKLALIKRTFDPVFSVSRLIWNQLRQIF